MVSPNRKRQMTVAVIKRPPTKKIRNVRSSAINFAIASQYCPRRQTPSSVWRDNDRTRRLDTEVGGHPRFTAFRILSAISETLPVSDRSRQRCPFIGYFEPPRGLRKRRTEGASR